MLYDTDTAEKLLQGYLKDPGKDKVRPLLPYLGILGEQLGIITSDGKRSMSHGLLTMQVRLFVTARQFLVEDDFVLDNALIYGSAMFTKTVDEATMKLYWDKILARENLKDVLAGVFSEHLVTTGFTKVIMDVDKAVCSSSPVIFVVHSRPDQSDFRWA